MPWEAGPNVAVRTAPFGFALLRESPLHGAIARTTRISAYEVSAAAGRISTYAWARSSSSTEYDTYIPARARVIASGSSSATGSPVSSSAARDTSAR